MPPTSHIARPRAAQSFVVAASVLLVLAPGVALGAATGTAVARPDPSNASTRPVTQARHGGGLAAKALVRPLALRIQQAAPPAGYSTFANSGSAALGITVVRDDGGALTDGNPRVHPVRDRAIRYPRHTSEVNAPHAVVQVVDRRGDDDLNPGSRAFRFGADFVLDKVSEDAGAGGRDNGDNLLQRGLFGQRAQYKVQLDHRVPSCRVKGSLGAVSVSSSVRRVRPGVWYRVRCVRVGSQLSIVLTAWSSSGQAKTRDSATGPIGAVSPRPSVPVSIGGKLAKRGVIDDASDQFNGRIDNVTVRIG
jgi:hypothetical protein